MMGMMKPMEPKKSKACWPEQLRLLIMSVTTVNMNSRPRKGPQVSLGLKLGGKGGSRTLQ